MGLVNQWSLYNAVQSLYNTMFGVHKNGMHYV